MSDTRQALLDRIEEMKDKRCDSFPNLICDEVVGSTFDDWCEPCQARTLAGWAAKQRVSTLSAERKD